MMIQGLDLNTVVQFFIPLMYLIIIKSACKQEREQECERERVSFVKGGATSSSFVVNNLPHLFIKYVINYDECDVYEREKYIASILKRFEWYPKLLYYDDNEKFLIFKRVGKPMNMKYAPGDLVEQFNQILDDMNSVNIQHNDIKPGELLVDNNNKIYLCDFGWASINNDLGCGIGLSNKEKPFGRLDDSNALERIGFGTYKDPKRKVGSQSEIPSIVNDGGGNLKIFGYQEFIINKNTKHIQLQKKIDKFSHINLIFKNLRKKGCQSIVDIGCSAGLSSLTALNNGFEHIVSLDHDPEYIRTLGEIKKQCNITKINEAVFSFGSPASHIFDVVFCGAIIHWIFSLTADFRNFDSIFEYLITFTRDYLVIEWISPDDRAIRSLNHLKLRKRESDEEYNTANFETAARKYTNIISKKPIDGPTRIIYMLQKREGEKCI